MTLRRLLPALLAAALAVTFACLDVPKPVLEGRACDSEHPCLGGFRCVASKCEAAAADASTPDASARADASSGPCAPGVPLCRQGNWYECPAGQPELKAACADAGLDCEGARGCLAPCGSACAPGTVCDESTRRCVRQPSCASPGDCGDAGTLACSSGACLPPSTQATVTVDTKTESAQTGCFATDAGSATPGEVTLNGYLVTPTSQRTATTIGFNVLVYRASEFDESDNPQPVQWGTAFDAGIPNGTGGAGAFSLANIPVNVDLVAESSGPGAVKTYQYFNIRSDLVQAGMAELAVISFDQALWDQLVSSAEIEVRAHRGGIAGQVFDCHSPSARVAGATAALDTPGRAFYTFPGLVGVDPTAAATSNTGRFFFFDVPAVPLTLVANVGETVVARRLRVRPDAVTVFLVRP
ncbi:MAG TPA: hypothetical protein VGK67_04565 [Myxococcales bacterium]|jgi:hypothetical protein